MFDIALTQEGAVHLSGRLDASQVEKADAVLGRISGSAVIDFKDLEYISSAGLGILLKTQKRLNESGNALKLINMNKMIRDVFHIARFDLIFQIE